MGEGIVISFYSYKGGVGRTFALANVATLLSFWEYKVLCVDWDLEAPGLIHYIQPNLISPDDQKKEVSLGGILELVEDVAEGKPQDWRNYVRTVKEVGKEAKLSLKVPMGFIAAGVQDENYIERLEILNWETLYRENKLGNYIEKMREEWKEDYDFILTDCRTGITDIGGISTVQLPDTLAFFFTANHQSLNGAVEVVGRIIKARNDLPYDRGGLICIPVVSRFDGRVEYELSKYWDRVFESEVESFYSNWIHKNLKPIQMLRFIRIPYVPRWSFGESLPVVEDPRKDAESINYALETLAALIAQRFSQTEVLVKNRDSFVSEVSKEATSLGEVAAPRKRKLRNDCEEIIQKNDLIRWRRLVDEASRTITRQILDWKPKGERAARQGGDEWEKAVLEVAEICLPGFVPIFTAVAKGDKGFWRESIRTLRQLAILEEQMGGGATRVLNIGARMLYIAGSLGSAVAVETKQIDFVDEWMRLSMPNADSNQHEEVAWADVYSAHRLPKGMGIRYNEPFKLLLKICESDYVSNFFPDTQRLNEYLFLANLLQSLVELRRCIQKERTRKVLEGLTEGNLQFYVWPIWCLMKNEDFESWTWDLFGSSQGVHDFVFPEATTITLEKFWNWWKTWKTLCASALGRGSGGSLDVDWRIRWLRLPGEPAEKDD